MGPILFESVSATMPAGKVNLYRLLRQLETKEEQINFLREHKLIPETMTCIKCLDTLKFRLNLVYPLFSKASKFQYFKFPCNPAEKIASRNRSTGPIRYTSADMCVYKFMKMSPSHIFF